MKIADVIPGQVIEKLEKNELHTGSIIKLDAKGWGFISCKEIPFVRIFFHWTSLRQNTKNFLELERGNQVEFIPVKSEHNGTRAIKIRVIEAEAHKTLEN